MRRAGRRGRLLQVLLALLLLGQFDALGGLFSAFPTGAEDDPVLPDLDPPAPPALDQVPPPVDPRLPNLTLHIAVAPDPVLVGQVATITLTVENLAPDPADDLVVTLETPAGAVP